MEYYAGLDVSLRSFALCIVDAHQCIWNAHNKRAITAALSIAMFPVVAY